MAGKPYTVKAVGGMFGGQTKGPFDVDELQELYKEYKGNIGGMFVKQVQVYRNGKLFFTFPRDGGIEKFLKMHRAAEQGGRPKPAKPIPPVVQPVPPLTIPVPPIFIPPVPHSKPPPKSVDYEVDIGPAEVKPLQEQLEWQVRQPVPIALLALGGLLVLSIALKK